MSEVGAHWHRIAARWHLVRPPLRPSEEDLAVIQSVIRGWSEDRRRSPRALVLGVTPEFHDLDWPAGTELRALDSSAEMIAAVWPGSPGSAVEGSWSDAPFPDESLDLILCDGGVGLLPWPDGQHALLTEAGRLLEPGGRFVVRLFAPAGRTGSLQDIESHLKSGRVRSLEELKLRLWGALQKDLSTGVAPAAVVAEIERMAGGIDRLVDEYRWSAEYVATLEYHRTNRTTYHLIDAEQLAREAKDRGFVASTITYPDNECGRWCPIVTLSRQG